MIDSFRETKIEIMQQFQSHEIGITVFLNRLNDMEKFRKTMKIAYDSMIENKKLLEKVGNDD